MDGWRDEMIKMNRTVNSGRNDGQGVRRLLDRPMDEMLERKKYNSWING